MEENTELKEETQYNMNQIKATLEKVKEVINREYYEKLKRLENELCEANERYTKLKKNLDNKEGDIYSLQRDIDRATERGQSTYLTDDLENAKKCLTAYKTKEFWVKCEIRYRKEEVDKFIKEHEVIYNSGSLIHF